MKKKDESTSPTIVFDKLIVVGSQIAHVVIESIDASLPDSILYKPMCYIAYQNTMPPVYSYYATFVVPEGSVLNSNSCIIEQINSINFITLTIDVTNSSTANVLYFMKITGMPAPVGFQLSTVNLTIIGHDTNGDEGGSRQGSGKTAVAYQDADEMPA